MIKRTINYLIKIIKFYRRFGIVGVRFLLNEKKQKNDLNEFRGKEYKYPLFLRKNTSDFPTFMQMIYNEDYNINYFGLKPNVIIDCGANIGLGSVFFNKLFPDSRIIAIEPDKANYDLLIKNTENYKNITTLNNGIWNKSSNLIIKDKGYGHWAFMVEEVNYENEQTIKAISINEIMTQFNISEIDILKIDIEGSEKELFDVDFEFWLSKTKIIIVELHDGMRRGASKSFFNAICKYNFSTTQKGENLIVFFHH